MTQSSKDGTRLAKRSFIVLGIVYVIFAAPQLVPSLSIISLLTLPLKMALVGTVSFSLNPIAPYALLLTGIILLIIGYLLAKRNIIGVYLGWLFILVGAITLYINYILLNILPLVILILVVYANY